VANIRGELPVDVTLDGHRVTVESGYWWSGGGAVLTIATVVPREGVALEVISTHIGHPDTDTVVTHLILSAGRAARTVTVPYPHHELNTLGLTRQCAYEHCNRLVEALAELGHTPQVHLGEHTFEQLEGISQPH
jgi:hypothetical protein